MHLDCNPELSKDRNLPYDAYLVQYHDEGVVKYDIVRCGKRVEIFDYYWDKYREGLQSFKQSEGRVNPKLWGAEPPKPDKKKK